MSVSSPVDLSLPRDDSGRALPVPVPTLLFPGGIKPGDIDPIHTTRMTRIMKNGEAKTVEVDDPVLTEKVIIDQGNGTGSVSTNEVTVPTRQLAEVWAYAVPAEVFPYFRTLATMYDDFARLAGDEEESMEAWDNYVQSAAFTTTSYNILTDILSVIVGWYELNMGRIKEFEARKEELSLDYQERKKASDNPNSIQRQKLTFEPSEEDIALIDSFFAPGYVGDENQKLLYAYMVLIAHNALNVEFEKVLSTWFSRLLDGKTEEELRQLTGAFENDLVLKDDDGNVVIGSNGLPVPSQAAVNLQAQYPIETLELLRATGMPIPDGLVEQAAEAQEIRDTGAGPSSSRAGPSAASSSVRVPIVPAASSSSASSSVRVPIVPASSSSAASSSAADGAGSSIGDLLSGSGR